MSSISANKKLRLYEMYNHKCAYCGINLTLGKLVIDHIKPKSKGGSCKITNLFPCCQTCNLMKSNRDIEGFRSYLQDIDNLIKNKATLKYLRDKKLIKIEIKRPTFYFEEVNNGSL